MYNSCKEAHIAVNDKIQQINANRQESIRHQYIDIALNEAVDVLLTQKIKAFEETGRYYDDLQVLKCTSTQPLMLNVKNRGTAFIPANYLHGIAYDAAVIFDKFKRYRDTKKAEYNTYIVSLKPILNTLDKWESIDPYVPRINISSANGNHEFVSPTPLYEPKGIFEFIDVIFATLLRFGYDVRYEYCDNKYYELSLIFRSLKPLELSVKIDNVDAEVNKIPTTYTYYSGEYTEITSTNEDTKFTKESTLVGMDLVSDVQRRDILQTYHNAKNRHIHPICTIESDKLYVDMSDNFIVTGVNIIYLRKPMLFNYFTDAVAELPFKTEIVNLAVQKLLGKLKDDGYQVAINETNALK